MARDIIATVDDQDITEITSADLIEQLLLAHEDKDRDDFAEYRAEIIRRIQGAAA